MSKAFPLVEKLGLKVWSVFDHRTPEASKYVEAVELEKILKTFRFCGMRFEQIDMLKDFYIAQTGKDPREIS